MDQDKKGPFTLYPLTLYLTHKLCKSKSPMNHEMMNVIKD